MFDIDLLAMFSDFGMDAVYGSETAKVILDIPDEVMLGNNVLAANNQLIFAANTFEGIDEGECVVIGSTYWYLRETPRRSADGAVMSVSVQAGAEPA